MIVGMQLTAVAERAIVLQTIVAPLNIVRRFSLRAFAMAAIAAKSAFESRAGLAADGMSLTRHLRDAAHSTESAPL